LSVASSFLAEIELGSQQVRDGVVKFMPYSFLLVNKMSQ